MLIGYARVSKTDGSQSLDLQRDALRAAGVDEVNLYHDLASAGCLREGAKSYAKDSDRYNFANWRDASGR